MEDKKKMCVILNNERMNKIQFIRYVMILHRSFLSCFQSTHSDDIRISF